MKFTTEEIETIKYALILSLSHEELEDIESVINILDRIDKETDLD